MPKTPQLPPKLEAVLTQLGREADLSVTQAVKLPYIVDVVASHVLGEKITEGTHQAWKHGVVTSQAWKVLTEAQSNTFRLEPVKWSEEKKLVVSGDEVQESILTPEQQRIVRLVAQEFGVLAAGDLGRLTKLMNPHVGTWGTNRRIDPSEASYERLSQDYQDMAEAVWSLTLEQLKRDSERVTDIEDAIA